MKQPQGLAEHQKNLFYKKQEQMIEETNNPTKNMSNLTGYTNPSAFWEANWNPKIDMSDVIVGFVTIKASIDGVSLSGSGLNGLFNKGHIKGIKRAVLKVVSSIAPPQGAWHVFSTQYHTGFIAYSSECIPNAYIQINTNESRDRVVGVNVIVPADMVESINANLMSMIEPDEQTSSITTINAIHPEHGMNVSTDTMTGKFDTCYPEFYPWITQSIDEYFAEYLASPANVLLLLGPPGTGKSTFIRTMILKMKMSALLAYRAEVISSPDILTHHQNHVRARTSTYDCPTKAVTDGIYKGLPPEVLESLNTVQSPALILEDCDIYLSKRSTGNHKMADLLNSSNGLVQNNHMKLILTANLASASDIDPALMRPGRCFDVLQFRELTLDEGNKARAVLGLTPVEFEHNGTGAQVSAPLASFLMVKGNKLKDGPIITPRFK